MYPKQREEKKSKRSGDILEDDERKIHISLQFPRDMIRRKKKVKNQLNILKQEVTDEFHEILEINKIFHKEQKEVINLGYLGNGIYKFPSDELQDFIQQKVDTMTMTFFLNEDSDESGGELSIRGSYIGGDKESHTKLQQKMSEMLEQKDDILPDNIHSKIYLQRNASMTDLLQTDKQSNNINKLETYILEKIIDQGEYGTVYLGQSKAGDLVAIKAIEPCKDIFEIEPHKYYLKEKIAYELVGEHQYVVSMLDNIYMGQYTFDGRQGQVDAIVLEFLPNGNLENLIDKSENQQHSSYGLDEESARIYFRQMLQGIEHIHNKGLCHRDIKLDNMVLNAQNECKIIDLTFVTDNQLITNHQRIGSNQYMAPEIGRCDEYYGQQADVYSLGVCLFRLVTGGFPCLFRAGMSDGIYLHLADKSYESFWEEIDNYRTDHNLQPLTKLSVEFKDLVVKMLEFEAQDRYNIAQIYDHPWMLEDQQNDQNQSSSSAVQYKNKFTNLLTKTCSDNKNQNNNLSNNNKQTINQQQDNIIENKKEAKQYLLPIFSPLLAIDQQQFLKQTIRLQKQREMEKEKNVKKGPLYSLNKSH